VRDILEYYNCVLSH